MEATQSELGHEEEQNETLRQNTRPPPPPPPPWKKKEKEKILNIVTMLKTYICFPLEDVRPY